LVSRRREEVEVVPSGLCDRSKWSKQQKSSNLNRILVFKSSLRKSV